MILVVRALTTGKLFYFAIVVNILYLFYFINLVVSHCIFIGVRKEVGCLRRKQRKAL